MAKFNLTTTLSKTIDEIGRFILEDVLSIRPVTDSCYASSVKTELKEYRQDELPEANNARRVWMRFSVIYHKLNWS